MIIQECNDIELEYSINNACTKFIQELEVLDYKYINSISESVVLNEGVKEIIIEFLKDVAAAVSKAWNAFKLLNNSKTRELIAANRNLLATDFKMLMPKDFEIPELKLWQDLSEQITVKDFSSYETWKQQGILNSKEDFIKSQYPNLIEDDKNIVQVMHDKCFRKIKETDVMHKDIIADYVTFIEGFEKETQNISKDIDTLNASNKNIEAKLQQIVGESREYIGENILQLLFEANDNQQQDKNQNKFRSADPNDQNENNNKKKLAEDRKNIVTYYKASTQVFSAKLKTCRNIETTSEKIVTNFINLQLKNKSSQEKKENDTVTTPNQGSTTIQK